MIKISLEQFLKINKNDLSGKTICFGTDTVYGIGVMVDQNIKKGLDKIYLMKQRNLSKPLAILAPNIESFIDSVNIYNQDTYNLMKLWPGALTMIFSKKDERFDLVTKLNTIGFRIPNCDVALTILNHLGLMATTSVNLSGEEPLNDINLIATRFNNFIDYLITDSVVNSTISSTVVDVSSEQTKVIRKGDLLV